MAKQLCSPWRATVWTIALLLAFVVQPLSAQQSETAEHYLNRLIKEATGAQPVRESRFLSQRTVDNAFRNQFRTLIDQNRAFSGAVSKLDHEKIKKVMTPESLADPALGADVLKELDAYALLEQEHGIKADESIANLRHTFETADWREPQRQNALKSFDLIMAASQASRHTYLQAEKAWVDSVDDLYHCAAEHKSSLKVENGTLQVFDDNALQELNKRIKLANSRREEMLKAQQTYKDLQNQRLKAVGIDPGTVGAQ
jgi:hypothetical protein